MKSRVARGCRSRRVARTWFCLLALPLLLTPAAADAGGISCRAELGSATAHQGDVVVLTVTAEGDFGWSADFQLPEVRGANIAGGGTSQSVSMVNGKTQASLSRTYYLTVTGDQDVTVGPVQISAGKEHCSTRPLVLKVEPGPGGQAVPPAISGNRTPATGNSGGVGRPKSTTPGGKPGDEVFITLQADRHEVYVGQQIILTFSYWHRTQPWNNPTYTPPRTAGFWREDLGTERNFRRVLRGLTYSVTQVRYALFPTRSGDLVVDPAELRFAGDVFDRFFGTGGHRRGPKVLRTDSLQITVHELPTPQPADFSGLVADHVDLTCSVDRDSVQTGEPVSLKVTLTADGFLKGFAGLVISPAADVQLHDAADTFDTSITGDHLVGRIEVEKILVPQRPGVMQTPPVKLVWFDAGSRSYRTVSAAVRAVAVGGEDLTNGQGDTSGFLRAGLTRVGRDLAFIHPVPRHLRRAREEFTSGPLWWALLLLPVMLLAAVKIYLGWISAAARDPDARRRKRAWTRAGRRLDQVQRLVDTTEICTGVARAVRGYVADCMGLPEAEVEARTVREFAGGLLSAEDGESLAEILMRCDSIRFGGVDAARAQDLVPETRDRLALLEKRRVGRLGKGKAGIAVPLLLVIIGLGCVWAGPATAVDTDPQQLLAEGNQAYTAGDLDQAVRDYNQVLALGVDDPVLHFNLGNTYARQGRLGKAVASYLRARRLAPRDRDIRRNLALVRQNLRDLKLADQSLPLFIAQVAEAVGFLSLAEWGVVVLALVWILCALAAWGLLAGTRTDGLRRGLLGLGAVLVVALCAAGWRYYKDEVVHQGVVIGDTVEVRSGPADSFPVLFEVHDGLTVHLNSLSKGWRRISLGGDWTGWLPADQVEPVHRVPSDQGR